MFKKLLVILSSFSVGVLTTASVVSCGPVTFNSMMNWKNDTETFYGVLANPVSTWSSGKSQNQADSDQFANVVDSLLQNDQYNEIIGDIADGWKSDADFKKWTVHINPKAEWFNPDGTRILDKDGKPYMIKAHDVANTARYIYNPYSITENLSLWENVQGHDELNAEINAFKKTYEISEQDKIDHPEWVNDPVVIQQRQKAKEFTIDFIITKYIAGDLGNDPLDQIEDSKFEQIAKFVGGDQPASKAAWKQERDDFQKNNPDKMLLNIDDATGEATFNMLNPSVYFPSLLTYVAFAPMPFKAVDWLSGTANNYGSTYDSILNSGAYYVSEFNPSSRLVFKANENHRDKDDIHIKTIRLHVDRRTNPSAGLEGFRSRDNSHVTLRSDDVGGWMQYIGSDPENPNFEGVHYQDAAAFGSWGLLYNFGRITPQHPNPKDEPINWALSQVSTRALISYALDRQIFDKYWTRITDPVGQEVSSLSYNRFVPQKLIYWSGDGIEDKNYTGAGGISGIKPRANDYTELVNDQYLMKIADPASKALGVNLDGESEVKKANLGGDLFYHNDYIAYSSLGYDYENQSPTTKAKIDELQARFKQATSPEQKIQILIEKINYDYEQLGIPYSSSKPVTFDLLVTALWANTLLSPLNSMVRTFNEAIPNNPIQIRINITATHDDFLDIRSSKNFSMTMGGWSPDYLDPSTFLDTLKTDGAYNAQQNGATVIGTDDDNPNNSKFAQLRAIYETYDAELDKAKAKAEFERYNDFAKQESFAIYTGFLFNPIYIRDQSRRPMITFQDIFSLTTVEVGTSRAKYIRRKMNDHILNREEFDAAKQKYEDNRQASKDAIKNTLQ